MNTVVKYLLSLLAVLLVSGCDMTLHETDICDYSVQLQYNYNEENTSRENKVTDWVKHIDEYIFDSEGVLCQMRRVTEQNCINDLDSEMQLPEGRYSVIAVGNRDERSLIYDAATNGRPTVGSTLREDMRMMLDAAETFGDGTRGHCEELFHGYRTFTVQEDNGASRVRVDMINAHFELRFRITWKNIPQAPSSGLYYAIMQDIPSEYNIMPEYVYPAGSFDAMPHDPELHDKYDHTSNDVIHHIPHVTHNSNNLISHSNTTYLNADGEVWGKFVNYRIKVDTEPIMMLYYATRGVRSSSDPMVLPREIHLRDYFTWIGQDLDYELKQEYAIDIVVDGDKILISPFDDFNISDWSEGGILN